MPQRENNKKKTKSSISYSELVSIVDAYENRMMRIWHLPIYQLSYMPALISKNSGYYLQSSISRRIHFTMNVVATDLNFGSPERNWTSDAKLFRLPFYQLNYRRIIWRIWRSFQSSFAELHPYPQSSGSYTIIIVEHTGFEPVIETRIKLVDEPDPPLLSCSTMIILSLSVATELWHYCLWIIWLEVHGWMRQHFPLLFVFYELIHKSL